MKILKNKKVKNIFFVSFFTASTVLFFIPSLIFLTNTNDFSFIYEEIALILATITLAFSLLVAFFLFLPLKLRRNRLFKILLSTIFIIGVLSWLQSNILVWNFGSFDGKPIDWNKHLMHTYIDCALWLLLIFYAIAKPDFFLKFAKKISFFLIIMQLLYTGSLYIRQPEIPSFKKFRIDESKKYEFSNDKNIVYLIIDTLQGGIFEDIINEDKQNYQDFDGFIFYPDTLSSYNRTDLAIPSLLTETEYKHFIDDNKIKEWTKKAFQKCSLFNILSSNSFDSEVYTPYPEDIYFEENTVSNYKAKNISDFKEIDLPDILKLADVSLFRISPTILKKNIYSNQKWQFQNIKLTAIQKEKKIDLNLDTLNFINKFEKEIKANKSKKKYKLYHLFGSHPPYEIDRNLKYTDKLSQDASGYYEQTRGMLTLVKRFIKKLKEENIYDNTMIVVLGDHGVGAFSAPTDDKYNIFTGTEKDELDNRHIVPKFRRKQANPALLIKPFKTRGELIISQKRAHLMDLSTTVLASQNLQGCTPGWGINLLDPNINTDNRIRRNNFNEDIYIVDGDSRYLSSWKTRKNKWVKGEKKPVPVPIYNFGSKVVFGNLSVYTAYVWWDWDGSNIINTSWVNENMPSTRFGLASLPKRNIQLEAKVTTPDYESLFVYLNGKKITPLSVNKEGQVKATIPAEFFNKIENILIFGLPNDKDSTPRLSINWYKME